MSTDTQHRHADYEALGIFPDTWACISVMSMGDSKRLVWALAQYNVPCRVSHDADGKRWHVAVQGGLAASPAAWLATIRPDADDVPVCEISAGQHPQALRV